MRFPAKIRMALFILLVAFVAGVGPTEAAPKKQRRFISLSQKHSSPPRKVRKTRRSTKKQAVVAGRAPRRYLRSFSGIATAYVPIDTPMEGGRWTCTMRDGWATKGVAVDPRKIRLGSLLYIPGYGRALADDTGGRIKGRHVDVRQHSVKSMRRWGVKKVRIYVLREPKRKARRLAT